jgi:hypothetical protein
MKRIGTVFSLLTFMLILSMSANAQVIHTALHPTVTRTNVPPLISPPAPHFSKPLNVQLANADTTMSYYDTTTNPGMFNWYSLPSHLNLNFGTQANPIDSQFVMDGYAERFSLPKAGLYAGTGHRYLDSVEILFAPLTLPTDGTTDSLVVEVRPGITLFETIQGQTNPDTLFGFDMIAKPLQSSVITTDNLVAMKVYDTILKFNYKLPTTVGSDFFIDLHTTDTDATVTQFLIRGDSVTFNPALESPLTVPDQDIYRGMYILNDPNNRTYQFNENDYAGIQFTNADMTHTDYFYSNFIIIAYMSNQLESAVDATGNPQFVLEPCFPNPVSASTEIDYNLTTAAPVTLTVYNQLGQQVATAVNTVQSAGTHSANFNVGTLPNGMYYYKLQSGEFSATQTMVISR